MEQANGLVVRVFRASSLRNTQFFGSQDPYALCSFQPDSGVHARTLPVEGGGTAPEWDPVQELFLGLSDSHAEDTPTHLNIELWNRNLAIDDIIGSTTVALADVLNAPAGTIHELDLDTGGHIFVSVSRQGHTDGQGSFLSGSAFMHVSSIIGRISWIHVPHMRVWQDFECTGLGQW